ncbi:MAG: hypothetical protein M0T85_07695 [Dehalococcoidales bacterium]|nr:hypothetical protein [Dehalococcoidales bacterium]
MEDCIAITKDKTRHEDDKDSFQGKARERQQADKSLGQLRNGKEQLVITSIRAMKQAEEGEHRSAELDAVITSVAEALVI